MAAKPRVVILGAGIGGLIAALALLRRGFAVEVHEQAQALREVGAGVQISSNGARVLYELGVGEAVAAVSSETRGKEIRLWNTGQAWPIADVLAEAKARYGYPYFTVYRPDLLAALEAAVRAAAPQAIHLGHKAEGFEATAQGVRLRFTDGDMAEGDVLVGADGIHSVVRRQLWGEGAARFTGLLAWRGVIPMARLPAHLNRPVGSNWVGPGRHVVHYPLRCGELMNFVGVVEGVDWQVESWTARGSQAELHRDFAGWHPDIHAMIDAIETPFRWAFLARDPLPRWGQGRVTLLGDACHPTLPFMAQGAVMAIEDGFILARALAEIPGPEAALDRYEAARRDRTARVVTGSAANTKRFHNPELAHAEGAAAYVAREFAVEAMLERTEWLYTYDVTQVAL
ncbi:FAD-dependent monooxygenase [Siccirubricoccus sp. KC 17139]|uniref:FAD-dependent monooxygenase n=1 Tax=Siccirubricoccus soli TaxID=2899147 RepID=A0ABT1DDD2_9PROT|nr:FAD-dependent monooxygenase [Siccirubricoccus soli]MCO6418950.1 FAD-dependent monooxygenase [Siccirubricoccus soli]MCP2685085.1 FAD-dependent monooxygenase [Siccirubricoccus soli]